MNDALSSRGVNGCLSVKFFKDVMQDLQQQLEFINELDRLKSVYRQALVKCDDNRFENSAEHSWHIALTAHVLAPYAQGDVTIARVVLMLLIHDIVEIDAGDTFAFADQASLDGQHEKEIAAANRLFGLLPENQCQHFYLLWLEFEAAETDDAQFAKAIDRILPLLQNMQNNGGSWVKHGVSKSKVLKRNQYLEKSAPALWQYVLQQIDVAVANNWLIDA